ncbi:universal stress protein [Actinopolymorpha sp. B17G11]|uniref:universal stress protein n=1 Tax=Actinopolymorpha sp. B17G11 TaxID=3160861 RepID=UPI0032E45A94
MVTVDSRPVVVGADGSEAALDAVTWAAREAAFRHVTLRIVHAFAWPMLNVPTVLWQEGQEAAMHAHAELVLAEAEKVARSVAPALDVSTEVVTEMALPLLLTASRHAAYVVVGTSGVGALADAVAGSPTVELVAKSHAPVVVVRGTPSPDRAEGLVVVGVDGSPQSAAAVEVGTKEAALRGGRLMVVHVSRHGPAARLRRMLARTPADLTLTGRALTGWRREYPDLPVEERVATGHPAGVLVDLSERASLVVVGTRGRGGFTGMLLGSTSQALLHHARCPVIVVAHRQGEAQ